MTQTTSSSPLAAMRRADALVVGGAFLVLVFSFLPQLHGSYGRFGGTVSLNMWHAVGLVEIFAVPLVALAVAGFALLDVLRPELRETPLVVATPAQWRDVLSVVPVLGSLFALFLWHQAGGIGYGAFAVFLFTIVLAVGAIGASFIPALDEPLTSSAPTEPVGAWSPPPEVPDVPEPAADEPQAPAAPEPAAAEVPEVDLPGVELPEPTVTAAPTTYAVSFPPQPTGPEAPGQPAPPADEPAAVPTTQPAAQPAVDPFWACFPTVRPLVDFRDQPVGQVTPEEWYLVLSIDGRGATVQTTDGRQGLLGDLSGMVRADA